MQQFRPQILQKFQSERYSLNSTELIQCRNSWKLVLNFFPKIADCYSIFSRTSIEYAILFSSKNHLLIACLYWKRKFRWVRRKQFIFQSLIVLQLFFSYFVSDPKTIANFDFVSMEDFIQVGMVNVFQPWTFSFQITQKQSNRIR